MTSKTHRFASCHRHPTKPVTGFCASCLRERLAGIESSSAGEQSLPSPELRRTKSCSGGDPPPFSSSTAAVPRRRSCEIRPPAEAAGRSALSDLFDLDDGEKKKRPNRNLVADSRFEITVEERENGGNGATRVCGDGFVSDEDDNEETRTMKELIDLEFRRRKNAGRDFIDIAGSFCKRLRKWRRKQKSKKNNAAAAAAGHGGGGVGCNGTGAVEKNGVRGLRETQSEVGEYGFLGRRSCDTDPRLSVDAGRMSLDDSRLSFEAARASWDGYLIGKTSCSRFSPMVHVNGRVLEEEEEEVNLESGGENCPGGSSQTKDYYSDSLNSQWRRSSFDRSSSRRKPSMADVDELRVLSNAKVSPATTELFYGAKVLITDKDLRDGNLNDDVQSGCVMGSGSKDACDVATGVNQNGLKKFHKWVKKFHKLGLVQRRREDKMVEEECGDGDLVKKPIAESWQKLRRAVNGHASESVSHKLIRSYSVSCRNPCRMDGLVNSFGGPETNGSVLNGRQDFMLQRNGSVSYSPSNVDTGLLRFYLTPLKSYKRSKSGKSSSKD